jgi:hypothetical protein
MMKFEGARSMELDSMAVRHINSISATAQQLKPPQPVPQPPQAGQHCATAEPATRLAPSTAGAATASGGQTSR